MDHVDVRKCTPGPATITRSAVNCLDIRGELDKLICQVYRDADGLDQKDWDDAALIREAFTVASETGMGPRQLAEQRAELLKACKAMLNIDNPPAPDPDHIDTNQAVAMMRAALAPAEKGE